MGDTDTDQQESKGGGALGVVGGAAGAYAGGAIGSHFVGRPDDLGAQITAAEKAKAAAADNHEKTRQTKLFDDQQKGTENKRVYDEFKGTEATHAEALGRYRTDLNEKWDAAIREAKPEQMGKLRLANLEAQQKVLEGTTSMVPAERELALNGVKAQIEEVKKVTGAEGFKDLPTEAARDKVHEALDAGWKRAVPEGDRASVGASMATHVHKDPKVLEAMEKADKELAEKIAKAVPKDHLEPLAAKAKEAAGKWQTLEATLETTKPLAEKTQELEKLQALKLLNEETGWSRLSRPVKLFNKVGTGGKAAILASAVALGAATYGGIRAYRNRDSDEPQSHTERLEQQRAAAAATPSAGIGA